VGAGICVVEEPRVFRFSEGSKQARVTHPEVPLALEARMRDIARQCPNAAIIVHEDDGTCLAREGLAMAPIFFQKCDAAKNWGFRSRSPQTLDMIYLPDSNCWVWPEGRSSRFDNDHRRRRQNKRA
jgi:ferredoxin